MRCMGHSPADPLRVQSGQLFLVVPLGEHLGLEPTHGVGACCSSFGASPSTYDPHGRVLGQLFSVVGVLVTGQTAEYRLT